MHKSIATLDSPEFINLQPLEINPLMSSCEIKVLYVGQNRNHSCISKETAIEISKTLRGAPIVGYFKPEKEDFRDHGEQIIFDGDDVQFNCLTKPYGFVAPNARVWFQNFEDHDDFGNVVTREYLMTTGYLWTGQYPEAEIAIQEGRPQSMELDENTLDGKWSTDSKTGMDFFIINDATFSKLCILGDDVEPCFEGASVNAPEVSKTFNLNTNFKNTLFSMIQDLKKVTGEGGENMDNIETSVEQVEEKKPETQATLTNSEEKQEESVVESESSTDNHSTEKFSSEEKKQEETSSSELEEEKPSTKNSLEDDPKYQELLTNFNELSSKFKKLETEYNKLVEYKKEIENSKKEDLINNFSMLTDEEKQDVVDHKEEYSYEDIEAKLSIIYTRKQVNTNSEEKEKNNSNIEQNPITTFNFNTTKEVPGFVSALIDARDKKNDI